MRDHLRGSALAALFVLASATAALAHPHIWIDAKANFVFDDKGELSRIENSWSFDEAFSVWQIQGLDTNSDGITSSAEMQELADENLDGLGDYGFYTSAGEGDRSIDFVSGKDAKFEFKDNRSTLTFSIVPTQPYRIGGTLEVGIADPEYYVSISFADLSDITLENAPAGCSASLEAGHDMSDDLAAKLFAIPPDVTKLPSDLEVALRGVQGSILISCPASGAAEAAVPATALDAVTQVAQTKPLPFGGPPVEPGFKISPNGPLGWLVKAQESFYLGLEDALKQIKENGNAFWVLGGLSFLYGIFHAAGPGHGKVVIASYVLANEAQARRGILLSFASALLQSVVAVVFVGVALAILGLSSAVMNDAVGWLEKGSYALMTLLGLWLIARKLFGWGHSHPPARRPDMHRVARAHLGGESVHALNLGRQPFRFQPAAAAGPAVDAWGRVPGDAHYGHDHGDEDHEGHHHHVVTPDAAKGDWREQLAVVVSVGLRPCSGALVVLAFALTQGILLAGIAAVFLMGLGTAITVAVLATLATGAKGLAGRLLRRNDGVAGQLVWWAELAGAVLVLLFGAALLYASI